jgi:hypothetical protein
MHVVGHVVASDLHRQHLSTRWSSNTLEFALLHPSCTSRRTVSSTSHYLAAMASPQAAPAADPGCVVCRVVANHLRCRQVAEPSCEQLDAAQPYICRTYTASRAAPDGRSLQCTHPPVHLCSEPESPLTDFSRRHERIQICQPLPCLVTVLYGHHGLPRLRQVQGLHICTDSCISH